MASKKTAPQAAARTAPQQARLTITLELVAKHAPHNGLASNLARTFGLDEVDYAAVREGTEEHVALGAKALEGALNDKAAYSDETARVYRSETARRSDLKAPTIPVSDRPGWCRLVGRFRHVTRAKSGSSNRCQRVCIGC